MEYRYGHKGFGLGLMVESLTMALAGHGRADFAEELGDMSKAQGLNDRYGSRNLHNCDKNVSKQQKRTYKFTGARLCMIGPKK